MADPKAVWDNPAISTMEFGNHAVCTDRGRYIHYTGGGEELYDHDADPNEWTNFANKPEHAAIKTEVAKQLPSENKPSGSNEKTVKPAKKK